MDGTTRLVGASGASRQHASQVDYLREKYLSGGKAEESGDYAVAPKKKRKKKVEKRGGFVEDDVVVAYKGESAEVAVDERYKDEGPVVVGSDVKLTGNEDFVVEQPRGRTQTSSWKRVGRTRHDSDSDLSPPRVARGRTRHDSDSDLSPPRQPVVKKTSDAGEKRMESGMAVGLTKGEDVARLAKEARELKEARFANVSEKAQGKGQEAVFRDRHGRRLEGLEEFLRQQEGRFRREEEEEMEWGVGRVQREKREAAALEAEESKNRPFAVYANDHVLNNSLRERERWDDPMKQFAKKEDAALTRRGRPKYRGPPAPANRFGIEPDYLWDGVDRSNGYEARLFAQQADSRAKKEAAYLWSVSDM